MDAGNGTVALQEDDLGKDASDLVNAIAGHSWIAAVIAAVVLVVALLKKFGVTDKKPTAPPPPIVTAVADATESKSLLSKGLEKRDE